MARRQWRYPDGTDRVCDHCGRSFTQPQSRGRHAKHCSSDCSFGASDERYRARRRHESHAGEQRECARCGGPFTLTALGQAQRYCGKPCARAAERERAEGRGYVMPEREPTAGTAYASWRAMIDRCRERPSSPRRANWHRYGGRGITVCDRWEPRAGGSFANFLADMGERPEGMTLDRVDPDGNYEPGNCQWATPEAQTANRAA